MAIASLLFVRIYRKTTRRQLHTSAEMSRLCRRLRQGPWGRPLMFKRKTVKSKASTVHPSHAAHHAYHWSLVGSFPPRDAVWGYPLDCRNQALLFKNLLV